MRRTWLKRWRIGQSAVAGIVFLVGLLGIDLSSESRFEPGIHTSPLIDLLAWIPDTDQSRRAFAAWSATDSAPLELTAALDQLSIVPGPFGLGRSSEWQRITGISASQVTGWASAPGAGVTVLSGAISLTVSQSRLERAGYARTDQRSVPIWLAARQVSTERTVEGDNLRALNAIAIYGDRAIVGVSEAAVRAALDAANGDRDSLAGDDTVKSLGIDPSVNGFMIVDQRDLAVDCGVSRGWRTADFTGSSGRSLAVVYRLDPGDRTPLTSIWVEFADDLTADSLVLVFDQEWREGYVNQLGMGGYIADLASVRAVYRSGNWVVAELAQGRDNGWVRSGVRFLIAICEQSSTLVPPGGPPLATPVSSPSPMESP